MTDLSRIIYYAILDLPPFNHIKCQVYVDHHTHPKSSIPNAKSVLYDPEASSTAELLLNYIPSVSNEVQFLVKVAKMCDTGQIDSKPPIITDKISDSDPPPKIAWWLEDLILGSNDLNQIQRIVFKLSTSLDAVFNEPSFLNTVDGYRRLRKRSINTVSDILVENITVAHLHKHGVSPREIARYFLSKGSQIVAIVVDRKPGASFVILRSSGSLTTFSCGDFVQKFGGGGHRTAAAAPIHNASHFLTLLQRYAERNSLSYNMFDID